MKTVFKKVFLGVLTLGILAGCSGEESTIVIAPLPKVDSQFTPDSQWSDSVGDGVDHYFSKLSPQFAYDKLFVASRDGVVKALDSKTGDSIWETDLTEDSNPRLSGGVTAAYGHLYVGTENGEVISLDAKTGEITWRVSVKGEVLAKPVADSNLIIVNTSRGILVALDQETGVQKWAISTEVPNLTLRGDSTPVTISGGVFWGTANGRLAGALVDRGQLIWQIPVGIPKGSTEIDRIIDVDSSPIVFGSTLYTVGINGQLMAIDLHSAKPIWKRKYSSANEIATDGSHVFVITDKDDVVAVDARSGTKLWKNDQLSYRQLTAPVIIDNYLVVGDSFGYLHWIDRSTGKFVAQQEIDSSGLAVAPTLLPDGYVVISRDGDIEKFTLPKTDDSEL